MQNLKKPHHLLSRLLQTGAVVGTAGLLYLDLANPGLIASYIPVFKQTSYINDTSTDIAETEADSSGTEPDSPGAEPDSSGAEADSPGTEPDSSGTEPDSPGAEPNSPGAEPDSPGTEPTPSDTDSLPLESAAALLSPAEYIAAHQCWTPYELAPGLSLRPSWSQLQDALENMIESYSGTWSLCLKDLSSGRMITINDRPQSSASLIKLYIMGAVLETMDQENLIPYLYQTDLVRSDVEELRDLLYEMISVSDNDAANELVRYLDPERRHQEGMECVNSFIQRNGFSDTRQTNGLGDPELWYDPDTLNATSAKDCVSFLEQVYNGTMVSHLASRFMETLLMEQEIIYKIPYTLPKDSLTANKSGETDTTENDAAIVYSAGGDYILCIMSTDIDLEDKDQSVDQIRNLSEAVYSFFNPSADSIMYKIENTVGYPEDETEESQTAVIGSTAYQDERIYEYHIRRKP